MSVAILVAGDTWIDHPKLAYSKMQNMEEKLPYFHIRRHLDNLIKKYGFKNTQ